MQREQIIQVTLDLIQEKESATRVNLREVARALGCAHTNIYNYFGDFDQLLWAALDMAIDRLVAEIAGSVKESDIKTSQLERFCASYIDFYLAHKGWFRLFWVDPLKRPRPADSAAHGEKLIEHMVSLFQQSIYDDLNRTLRQGQAFHTLHVVHCYLYGEMAIFLSGRGLIRQEEVFRTSLLKECLNLTHLLIKET